MLMQMDPKVTNKHCSSLWPGQIDEKKARERGSLVLQQSTQRAAQHNVREPVAGWGGI